MLRTIILKNEMAWALAFVICGLTIPCFGQDETFQDPTAKQQSNVFEKLFGKSTTQSSPAKKPKSKVPAMPTAGKPSRSGFLIPLKSFSRTFRGPDSEELEEIQDAPPVQASRPPREPFRNLPRLQDRRDRETYDLNVEQIAPESTASIRDSASRVAPIVTPESIRSSNSIPLSKKAPSSGSTNSKQVVAGSSKNAQSEILIESNSTSRRTAVESDTSAEKGNSKRLVENSRFVDNVGVPQKTPRTTSPTKTSAEAKGLIDLGFASEPPPATLVSSAERELDNKLVSRAQPQGSEIPRTAPQTSVPKRESPDKSVGFKDKANASLPVSPQVIRREMSVPGVRVTVNGPASILVNDASLFEVVAQNEGAEPLNGLIVRIAVPTHVAVSDFSVTDGAAHPDNDQDGNTIIWEIGQIPAGNKKTAAVRLMTPKAEHFALGVEWTVVPQNADMRIEVQQPQLAIALEGPSEVTFGKPQLYRIRVRNTGNANVKSVTVAMSAEPYGSNQSNIGDIDAGSERIVEVELTFQQSGALPIVATATSEVSKVEARSAIDVQVKQSELIATWFGPAEFYQGSVVDYELELNNVGAIAAIGTNCIVKLPTGAEVIAMPPGAARAGDSIKWEINKLEPNEKISVPFRISLSKIGENLLAFTGTCSSSSEAKAEFKTTIDAIADLHLTVVDPVAPAPVGQPVVYEIVIANRGRKSANDVEVIGQFSEGIEPVRVDGHAGRIVPGQAIFNVIPSIGANDKLVLRIHAEASKPGVHRFRVEVKSKGSETDLLEEESTRYLATGIKGDRR